MMRPDEIVLPEPLADDRLRLSGCRKSFGVQDFTAYGAVEAKLRDELLNMEIFTTLYEAQVPIEQWWRHYNAVRPHSLLGYRPPVPEAILRPSSDRSGQIRRWPIVAGSKLRN
jgi:transposase InsO family protein